MRSRLVFCYELSGGEKRREEVKLGGVRGHTSVFQHLDLIPNYLSNPLCDTTGDRTIRFWYTLHYTT